MQTPLRSFPIQEEFQLCCKLPLLLPEEWIGFMFQCFPELCISGNLKNNEDFFFFCYELVSAFRLPSSH